MLSVSAKVEIPLNRSLLTHLGPRNSTVMAAIFNALKRANSGIRSPNSPKFDLEKDSRWARDSNVKIPPLEVGSKTQIVSIILETVGGIKGSSCNSHQSCVKAQ